jgi:hypothetical protein
MWVSCTTTAYGDQELIIDVVVSGLFEVSSPSSPDVSLYCAENTKFDKYSEGVRSRPDTRAIPFEGTELGALGDHATDFFDKVDQIDFLLYNRYHRPGKVLVKN